MLMGDNFTRCTNVSPWNLRKKYVQFRQWDPVLGLGKVSSAGRICSRQRVNNGCVEIVTSHQDKLILLVDTRVQVRRQKKTKKSLKMVVFDCQVSLGKRSQALERNIQKLRPGRSAMQWHCGLRLFFKEYLQYDTYATVLYSTWSVVLRPLFSLLLDKRAPNNPV